MAPVRLELVFRTARRRGSCTWLVHASIYAGPVNGVGELLALENSVVQVDVGLPNDVKCGGAGEHM